MSNEMEGALWAILDLLRPYSDELVLIGGWVPYLQLNYGRAAKAGTRTSRTGEADLIIPTSLRRGARKPIAELLAEAEFHALGDTKVVWVRDPGHGEKIEFFQPHRGTAGSRGRPVLLPEQPGLEALPLDHLWVLESFNELVLVPAPAVEAAPAPARIPLLGAYVLNKANTFNLRGGPAAREKAGKDLLYLRDIMAAGEEAETVIVEDLNVMGESDHSEQVDRHLRRALTHLEMVAPKYHPEAARILATRDSLDPTAATADVEGHMFDLIETLRGTASTTG